MDIHEKVNDRIKMNKRHKKHNKALVFLALVVVTLGFFSITISNSNSEVYLTALAISTSQAIDDHTMNLSMLPFAFIFSTFIISVLLVYKIKEIVVVPKDKLKKIKPANRKPENVKENVIQKMNHWFEKNHK